MKRLLLEFFVILFPLQVVVGGGQGEGNGWVNTASPAPSPIEDVSQQNVYINSETSSNEKIYSMCLIK